MNESLHRQRGEGRCTRTSQLHAYTGQQKKLEQKLPVLFLQTLLYTFLVSVSPGIDFFLQKVALKFRKLSYSAILKSKR